LFTASPLHPCSRVLRWPSRRCVHVCPSPSCRRMGGTVPTLGWTLSWQDEQLTEILLPSLICTMSLMAPEQMGLHTPAGQHGRTLTYRMLSALLDSPCPYAYPLSGKL
jgi:hypothetical protein